ncbi:MAG TPA: hypothetical protein VFG66_03555 [Gemmatimonadales bacterium]|nr:hypothetical protein [Gemmatimonadales bacterium]
MTGELLRPRLQREHASWLEEVAEALGPAQRAEAGPWARWNALRYLETTFPERVERERRMVQEVPARLTGPQRATLWALGELLDLLPTYIGHQVGLCHRAEEFSALTGRLQAALGRWCRAVEEDLGPLPASELQEALRATPPVEVGTGS